MLLSSGCYVVISVAVLCYLEFLVLSPLIMSRYMYGYKCLFIETNMTRVHTLPKFLFCHHLNSKVHSTKLNIYTYKHLYNKHL